MRYLRAMTRCTQLVSLFLTTSVLIGACDDASNTGGGNTGGGEEGGGSNTGAGNTGAGNTGAGNTGAGNTGAGTPGGGEYFPAGSWFYEDASAAPVVANSDEITAWMESANAPNGWGTGTMRVDFSIVVNTVAPGTAKRAYEPDYDYYYEPDCDFAPVPVPEGGAVEEHWEVPTDLSSAFSGYQCAGFDEGYDCHMLFFAPDENRLYEIYRGTIRSDNSFQAGCLAIWDTSQPPPPVGRGDQCTSADAAGFPIAPLLFTADEIAAGEINHAIRFILPNDMLRERKFARPATHGTNTSGPDQAPPYGAHFRLRADYPLDTLSPAAQVVARALQKYGMYHSDGGQIALTAASDLFTEHTWEEVGFDDYSLEALRASDFEIIDHGADIDVTFDCTRTPIIE